MKAEGSVGGIGAALREAARTLSEISPTPRLDAELLMAHALGTSREALLFANPETSVPASFAALLARRARSEPVAYIIGRRGFWTIELEVGPGVLIPRPDSETLIEAALAFFGEPGPTTILDLGTGPGTLLLAALDQWPGASGLGVDRSAAALAFAERNARRLGLDGRARFACGNWGDGIDERFDLILANPPYVAPDAALPREVAGFEPAEALFAAEEGLADHRRIATDLPRLLAPHGLACVEIGAGQAEAVSALYEEAGFRASARADLAGIVRCLVLAG